MSKTNPKSFKDLDVKELYRSAVEDFAIDVAEDEKTNKESLVAAFAETGVSWKDYVAQHPEVEPKEDNVVKLPKNDSGALSVEPVETEEKPTVRVREDFPVKSPDMWLIKMVRENPLYQTRGHTFTKEHPYALMNARDAQYVLSMETGFRQATPSELEEFYG